MFRFEKFESACHENLLKYELQSVFQWITAYICTLFVLTLVKDLS